MIVEEIEVDNLILDPSNARKHNLKNLEAIKGSLTKFGQQKPIVINDKNIVIAGNGTLAAARELGWSKVKVVRSELSNTMQAAFAIADNRSAELAEWDIETLGSTLESLKTEMDLNEIGFSEEDLEKLIPTIITPGLTDDDAVPDTKQNEFGVVFGDIWQLGNHRLMCGDSTNIQHVERLMDGKKADMVFTDPPYGVGYEYNSHDDKKTQEEHFFFLRTLVAQALLFSEKMIITPGCYNLAMMINARNDFSHVGCWTKTNAMSPGRVTHFWTWEPIFFYGKFKRKRGNDVFNYPVGKQPDTGDHSCPKPIALWQDIVENFSEPSDMILDFFLGSGSTLIACEKTNRTCYGSEIDPHYCSVIIKRWQDYTGKTAVRLNEV